MPYAQLPSPTAPNIYYEDSDPGGDLPVIVWSHGFLMDHTMFAAQVQAFKGQFRCITWDQRGHGKTATNRLSPFDYYDSADDLSDLMAQLGIGRAILAGMSQGGFLTLRCALTNPSLAAALILLDTEADVMSSGVIAGDESLLSMWIKQGFSPQLGEIIASQIIGPAESSWNGQAYWTALWAGTQMVNLIPSFNALVGRDDISAVIGAITGPALVVQGEIDVSVPLAAAQALAMGLGTGIGANGSSTFSMIPGAGHGACMTFPDLVNAAITGWLNGPAVKKALAGG